MVFMDHKITGCSLEMLHALNAIGTLVREMLAIFRKTSSLPSFLPCSSNSSRWFLMTCFILVSDICVKLVIFSYLLRYLIKFNGEDVSLPTLPVK